MLNNLIVVLLGILFASVSFAQKHDVEINGGEIKISLGTKLNVSSQLSEKNELIFSILSDSTIEEPLDFMSLIPEDKVNLTSNKIEFMFCKSEYGQYKNVVLTMLHHYDKPIIFKAKIKNLCCEEFKETSITLKQPNVFSVEQWDDSVESIILYDFKLTEN